MIEIEAKDLKEMVTITGNAVNPRNPLDIFTGLNFSVEGTNLSVIGSDGMNTVQLTCTCVNRGGDNWRKTLALPLLRTMVKSLKGTVRITEHVDGIAFESGGFKGTVPALKSTYPLDCETKGHENFCTWEGNEIDLYLSDLANMGQYCDETHYELNCLWLDCQESNIIFVATDGFTLAYRRTDLKSDRLGKLFDDAKQRALKFQPGFLRALYATRKMGKINSIKFCESTTYEYVLFETTYNNFTVCVVGCLDNNRSTIHLVNWRDVVPEITRVLFSVPGSELQATLKRFPNHKDDFITLHLTDKNLCLTSGDFETSLVVDVKRSWSKSVTVPAKVLLKIVLALGDGGKCGGR